MERQGVLIVDDDLAAAPGSLTGPCAPMRIRGWPGPIGKIATFWLTLGVSGFRRVLMVFAFRLNQALMLALARQNVRPVAATLRELPAPPDA